MSDAYAGIPKSIKVGCYKFRIEVLEADDAEASAEFGHMNSVNQKIRLRPGMTAQNLADTFIHEVIHAINWLFDSHDGMSEEQFTLMAAHGLCSLWQDNPKAMKWWSAVNELGMKNG